MAVYRGESNSMHNKNVTTYHFIAEWLNAGVIINE